MRGVRVASVQFAPESANKEKNIRRMQSWIEKVMEEQGDMDFILFPELITTGYDLQKEEFSALSEMVGYGDAMHAVSRLAAKYRTYIAFGYAEKAEQGLYNSMVCIGRLGEVVANYRKIHPFDTEKGWCLPGDTPTLAETDFGKVGMMVCYDTSFPEMAGTLALMGADLLAISTNWEDPHLYDWDLITAARAFDNTLHVVGANRVGKDRINTFSGHSCILNPMGKSVSRNRLQDGQEGYLFGVLHLEETITLRNGYYRQLKDRRPEVYWNR